MREQSKRELVILSLLFTAAISVLNLLFAGGDIIAAAFSAPVIFVVMFVTMRLSNRVGRRIANRFSPPAEQPALNEPPEPTSERPQHAQRRRRRSRRRRRRS